MTKIEWADETWNPVVGCSAVSSGCTNCYAASMAHRLQAMGLPQYQGLTRKGGERIVWTGKVAVNDEMLARAEQQWCRPRRRVRKHKRIFVCSMGDLFHDDVPTGVIDRIFAIMSLARQHIFMVLTKRHLRLRKYMMDDAAPTRVAEWQRLIDKDVTLSERVDDNGAWPPNNVLLGVSVEANDQRWRIDALRDTPARFRFISFEPLLEKLDVLTAERLYGIDWAIIGGESGPRARPCDVLWIDHLVAQCIQANVETFVKQLGARPMVDGEPLRLEDRKGADMSEWPTGYLLRSRMLPAADSFNIRWDDVR